MIDLSPFLTPGACLADAIDDVMASVPAVNISAPVPTICIPEGAFRLSRPLDLRRRVHLRGAAPAGHGAAAAATIIEVEPGVFPAAIIINRRDTTLDTVADPTTEADGSVIEGVRLIGPGKASLGGHGIWLRARGILRDINVEKFPGDGIHIVATAVTEDAARKGNANLFRLDTVMARGNGGNGIFADGADVNAGVGVHCNVVGNGGWGICDSSFLGNTWVSPHASLNAAGSYKADNANARSTFVGPYAERNQPPAHIERPSIVIGGLCDCTPDTPRISATAGAVEVGPSLMTRDATGARLLSTQTGASAADQFMQMVADGDHSRGIQWYWTEADGTYGVRHARLSARRALEITSNLTPAGRFGRPDPVLGGYPWLPRGVFVGHATHGRHLSMGNAMPTGGGADGDIVLNTGTGPLLWKREGGAWVEKWADGDRPAE